MDFNDLLLGRNAHFAETSFAPDLKSRRSVANRADLPSPNPQDREIRQS